MAISRIRVAWTGFVGSPGVSTFYSLDPAADVPLLHGFFNSISGLLPNVVGITVEPTGDVLSETTGQLSGTWSTDAPTGISGSGGVDYAAPVGGVVIWDTGAVLDGSRLRGKTYIVPMSSAQFSSDGSLSGAAGSALAGAAASLAAASQLVVWHRPRSARAADGSRPAVTARAGGYASIEGSTVHDLAAVLTSRRD